SVAGLSPMMNAPKTIKVTQRHITGLELVSQGNRSESFQHPLSLSDAAMLTGVLSGLRQWITGWLIALRLSLPKVGNLVNENPYLDLEYSKDVPVAALRLKDPKIESILRSYDKIIKSMQGVRREELNRINSKVLMERIDHIASLQRAPDEEFLARIREILSSLPQQQLDGHDQAMSSMYSYVKPALSTLTILAVLALGGVKLSSLRNEEVGYQQQFRLIKASNQLSAYEEDAINAFIRKPASKTIKEFQFNDTNLSAYRNRRDSQEYIANFEALGNALIRGENVTQLLSLWSEGEFKNASDAMGGDKAFRDAFLRGGGKPTEDSLRKAIASSPDTGLSDFFRSFLPSNQGVKSPVKSDKSSELGGIDFNAANLNLQIKRDGKGIPLPISQQNLENIKLDGLTPVILDIKPAMEVPLLAELRGGSKESLAKV
ncbi:MAG: hypothetical protein HQL15_03300, partial [Candidatus Omnitrophica bacterium]|nr:hypothetical protein [Candidatus Omnitrophota bacterium]